MSMMVTVIMIMIMMSQPKLYKPEDGSQWNTWWWIALSNTMLMTLMIMIMTFMIMMMTIVKRLFLKLTSKALKMNNWPLAFLITPPHTTNYPQGLKNVYETDLRGNEVFLPNILTRLGNIFCGRDHFLCVTANDQSCPPVCRNVHKYAACCWFEHLWWLVHNHKNSLCGVWLKDPIAWILQCTLNMKNELNIKCKQPLRIISFSQFAITEKEHTQNFHRHSNLKWKHS